MDAIIENRLIERLALGFTRAPHQLNATRESDAELIRLPGTDVVLALTTDGVVEEIEAGLYRDPYLIGWMTVMVNASDLAAVGAQPLGLLLNQTLKPDLDDRYLDRLQTGIRDACEACGLHVLGGDVNFSARLQMSATALGLIPDGRLLTRRGCQPGDRLFASAPLGLGSAFALQALVQRGADRAARPRGGGQPAGLEYRPAARLREGGLLRAHATCCMDTSDGVIPTLDELMRLNGTGFRVDAPLESILHAGAVQLTRAAGLPDWLLLAGPHGEFELLFTVPEAAGETFLAAARERDWRPLELGVVTANDGLELNGRRLDTARVRNLFTLVGGDVEAYVRELLALDGTLRPSPAPRYSGS
ncbi:MAG: thiamine-monophosphate kinase [Gemmatimonadota bacterium]|nr:MAG: thiamine-monophosphate kinase [Gemmatimonadota bacterium]